MHEITEIRLPARLDAPSLAKLRRELADAAPGTRVLRGTDDDVFCLGLDLEAALRTPEEERARGLDDFCSILELLAAGERPTIAAVRGKAMGGGLGLACACDVVLASPDATFGLPEALFGLVPGMITPIVKARSGPSILRRMVASGEAIDAQAALRAGIVDEVSDRLDTKVAGTSRRLARAHPGAVGRLRRWIWESEGMRDEIRRGREHLTQLLESDVCRNRVRAFAEGMAPWTSETQP